MEKTNVVVKIVGGNQTGKVGVVVLWSDELNYQNVTISGKVFSIQNEWVKKEEVKMEKTTIAVKRIGEFSVIENPNKRSGYKMVKTGCTINGKNAEMVIEEQYKSTYEPKPTDKAAKMTSWKFISGDTVVDATAKVFTDFLTFTEITGMEVDINDILFDAENLFADLKKKEEEEKKAKEKIARAKAYDENYFITKLKPALEAKGHDVIVNITKEDFVTNSYRDVTLTVGNGISVGRDHHGWLQVRNGKGHCDTGAEKSTKSGKLDKHIETIEWVINADKQRTARKKEELKALAGVKENLESILGIKMVEKKEYHSRPNGPRGRSEGYETSYFVDAKYKDTYSDGLRFVESNVSQVVDGKTVYVKGFAVTHLPTITDPAKLKKIYDLLNE